MIDKSAQKKLMDGYNGTRSMRKQWKTVRLAVKKDTAKVIAQVCPTCFHTRDENEYCSNGFHF